MFRMCLLVFIFDYIFFLNRIVKVIAKVIDVNVVVLVIHLMHEAINVHQVININHHVKDFESYILFKK
jgi:hypothetical protein